MKPVGRTRSSSPLSPSTRLIASHSGVRSYCSPETASVPASACGSATVSLRFQAHGHQPQSQCRESQCRVAVQFGWRETMCGGRRVLVCGWVSHSCTSLGTKESKVKGRRSQCQPMGHRQVFSFFLTMPNTGSLLPGAHSSGFVYPGPPRFTAARCSLAFGLTGLLNCVAPAHRHSLHLSLHSGMVVSKPIPRFATLAPRHELAPPCWTVPKAAPVPRPMHPRLILSPIPRLQIALDQLQFSHHEIAPRLVPLRCP